MDNMSSLVLGGDCDGNCSERMPVRDKMTLEQQISTGIGCLSIVVNVVAVVVFATYPKLITNIPRKFTINQSVLDTLAGVFLIVAQYHGFTRGYYIGGEEEYVSAEMYCRLLRSNYTLWAVLSASTMNLLCITVERYLSIVHSIWHHRHITSRLANLIILALWLTGIFSTLLLAWDFHYLPQSGLCLLVQGSMSRKAFFGTMTMSWFFIVPTLTTLYCYSMIGVKIRVSKQPNLVTVTAVLLSANETLQRVVAQWQQQQQQRQTT